MRPPVALTIAGTDPSGGAGIQADLKAFTARGVYGASVATVLVAQNTHGVDRIYPIDHDFVSDQLDSVLTDLPVDATKTGMLSDAGIVALVAERAGGGELGFLVVDPVMVSTSGHRLLREDAVGALRERLIPRADLVTPNLPEAALLLGEDVVDAEGMRDQARRLLDLGPRAVLLKGGHLDTGEIVDVLALRSEEGDELYDLPSPRVATANTHGTGCTLSAAIAADYARLAHGPATGRPLVDPGAFSAAAGAACAAAGISAIPENPGYSEDALLREAVHGGQAYLQRALAGAAGWQLSRVPEGARGPVDHLVDLRSSL